MRRRRSLVLFAVCALGALAPTACRREPKGDATGAAAPISNELPPLALKDDTQSLLLTWIDDKGDFHVVQKLGDVPEAGREKVRVVITTSEAGTGSLVYVADLRKKNADGSFPVSTMTRATWDDLGADRRKARMEALAPSAAPPASSAAATAPPTSTGPSVTAPPGKRIAAIVYGASWCKPCHDAERYLRGRGVAVAFKDIESSDVIAKELEAKLERAKMPGAQIPIIDIGGRLLVGFSPTALDRAIAAASGTKTL